MKAKDIIYRKRFKYADDKAQYVFQLKKRNWKWLWLLLLLLPLLLLVKCDRDITVHTVDADSGLDMPLIDVKLNYTSHYLYNNGQFFYDKPITIEQTTDDNGKAYFRDLPCSVYSYIFYALSKAYFEVTGDCYETKNAEETCLFHYTWTKKIELLSKKSDIKLRVTDRETDELLAGATVNYKFDVSGKMYDGTAMTNAAGECELKDVFTCGKVTLSKVSCYGYADTTNVEIDVRTVLQNGDPTNVKLTPLKDRFTFFVKNKYTEQPVPGANVEVTLTSSNGNVVRGKAMTNVDGKGYGAYEDAFVLATVEIKASKTGYKDGQLANEYTVEEFVKQPEKERTVYLEPEPHMEEFQNIDSITNKPIAGVSNDITINSISGETTNATEISNRNGVFYVKALTDDEINIDSEHSDYHQKNTQIAKFDKGQKIYMQPKMVDLKFRTIDADIDELLPDCDLVVQTSASGVNKPVTSGNGEFKVGKVLIYEKISIIASKAEYTTNSTKVRNAKVRDLMNAPQERRDIPLNIELPPCNASASSMNNVKAGTVSAPISFNMGTNSGQFTISYDTGNACSDCIDIYNHKPGEDPLKGVKVFSSGQVVTDGTRTETVTFSNGSVITIFVTTGPSDGSFWDLHISCPNMP